MSIAAENTHEALGSGPPLYEAIQRSFAVAPAQRISPEGGGLPTPPSHAGPLELSTGIDIRRVANGVAGTSDGEVLQMLAFLAEGNPLEVMQSIERVRRSPAGAARYRDALPKHNIDRKILSTALAIPGTRMEREGLDPTETALRELEGSPWYYLRYKALQRATSVNEASARRNYNLAVVGGLAVLAAGEKIPPYKEILALP